MRVVPFKIHVPEERLIDLRERLSRVRWPVSLDEEGWADGTSLAFMQRLVAHWRDRFDWREQEARLNTFSHFTATVDGADIHFIHHKSAAANAFPLVLTHGWPGSVVEMTHIIGLLTDPAAHGGDPADAFDVVVPSLPGYGFSPAPKTTGVGSREIAGLWHGLMQGLGYQRFGAQGGDIGAGVSTWLARRFPRDVVGIHLNYIPGGFRPHVDEQTAPLTDEERAFQATAAAWYAEEGAYAALQGTKPQTLAYSLADSPVGLAAWISEKFRSWSDCGGDLESVVAMDELLTDISLYWFNDSITASLRLYKENRARPHVFEPGERVTPPMGMALFPKELPTPPRSWVERAYDVKRWEVMPRGGHFAALEQPELLAAEIRAFFRPLRASLNKG